MSVKSEFFLSKKNAQQFLDSLYWISPEMVIPYEEIIANREGYCQAFDWSYETPDDNYDGDKGAIAWWNSKICEDIMQRVASVSGGVYADKFDREKFYKSSDWRYIKYLAYFLDRGKCRSCKLRAKVPEYHHLNAICDFTTRSIYRNFSLDYIETRCEKCHKGFHDCHTRDGIYFIPGKSL